MPNDDDLLTVSKLYASALALTSTIEQHIAALPDKVESSFEKFKTELNSFASSKVLTSILTGVAPAIEVQKLAPEAIIPTRSMEAAGYDLYAVQDVEVSPGSVAFCKTGIAIELPVGYAGLIWPRSGLGSRGLTVLGGVIDQDYRGEICVLLTTLASSLYSIKAKDRIAQLLIQPVVQLGLKEVSELSRTTRGNKGFGSTGV